MKSRIDPKRCVSCGGTRGTLEPLGKYGAFLAHVHPGCRAHHEENAPKPQCPACGAETLRAGRMCLFCAELMPDAASALP